jgi:hypothetical protein
MTTRRTLLTLGVGLAAALTPFHPVPAAPAVPDMRGSYFGSFTSDVGNFLAADLNLTLQVKRLVSGQFSMGGVLQNVPFSGKITPTGGFTAKGRKGQGSTRVLIQLKGQYNPGGNGSLAIIQGQYTCSGGARERGTFVVSGRSNQP